jgi:NAD(P)-dependent dehydrogenase (short-subunit alcohol dehydrogenase family)
MNHAPTMPDPLHSVFAETLGHAPGRGRLSGRKLIVVGAGQRPTPAAESIPVSNGRGIALMCAREGAEVACIDVNAAAVDETVAQIQAAGGKAFAEVADVREAGLIAPLVARCPERLGGFDGLARNVGISFGRPVPAPTARWRCRLVVRAPAGKWPMPACICCRTKPVTSMVMLC